MKYDLYGGGTAVLRRVLLGKSPAVKSCLSKPFGSGSEPSRAERRLFRPGAADVGSLNQFSHFPRTWGGLSWILARQHPHQSILPESSSLCNYISSTACVKQSQFTCARFKLIKNNVSITCYFTIKLSTKSSL